MGCIIDGQTLSIGGPSATIGDTTFSLGPQGIAFADPSSGVTSKLAVSLAATIEVSDQSLTTDQNLGDVILTAITDGMVGFAGRREEIITTVPFPEAGASAGGAGEKIVVVTMRGGRAPLTATLDESQNVRFAPVTLRPRGPAMTLYGGVVVSIGDDSVVVGAIGGGVALGAPGSLGYLIICVLLRTTRSWKDLGLHHLRAALI